MSTLRPHMGARPVLSAGHARLRDAAIDYVAHGWGVIPGSACDGLTYTKGHTREEVGTLGPVLPSSRTLREAHAVWSRWHLAPYGILGRTGEVFDVIEAPTWLAVRATGRAELGHRMGPVSLAPTGARFLVEPGATLRGDLAAVRGVGIAEPGTLVPLPPTRVLHGQLTWWITPEQTRWGLGDSHTVYAALRAALAEPSAPDGARGEVRA